jgi:hypothetical protein
LNFKISVLYTIIAIDDKRYVNIIKENIEIQQTHDGQRVKFQFQFFYNLTLTKDHFLDDFTHYTLIIRLFYDYENQDSYLLFQDSNRTTSAISRILLICSQRVFHKKINDKMRKIP